jgi:hypothetical protein
MIDVRDVMTPCAGVCRCGGVLMLLMSPPSAGAWSVMCVDSVLVGTVCHGGYLWVAADMLPCACSLFGVLRFQALLWLPIVSANGA